MNSKPDPSRVAVVGGGLGGLAAAATLAARGHRVTLFDKNPWLGGKAAVLEQDGYRFDMGPTILTLPSVLKRIFAEAGRELGDYLELVDLDPQWRCFYTDGTTLDLVTDQQVMSERLVEYSNDFGEGIRYKQFLAEAKELHRVSKDFFFWKSVGGVVDTLNWGDTFKPSVLGDLKRLRMGSSVAKTVRKHAHDPRVAQMLDHFTQYVGSCPDASPAVLCGIAHMQLEEGISYPIGGTRAVPEALVKLGRELGVEYREGTAVKQILGFGGRATGVELADGEKISFDAVVSNCDAVRTYDELVEAPMKKRFRSSKFEPACSGVVLYLGLDKAYPQLEHHNFIFSEDPHEEFRSIYQDGQPAEDMTCYVAAPAQTEPGVAPAGGEALYVLVHAPYLRPNHDWSRMFPDYRQKILDKLKTTAGLTDIEDRIVTESHLSPQDIHDRYGVLNGAIYGVASHGKFLGAFKPANRSKQLDGLYLAGGAAHPGPGMPMVMMSGWIAADALDSDCRAKSAAA